MEMVEMKMSSDVTGKDRFGNDCVSETRLDHQWDGRCKETG